jgi:hypothetical protein
VPRIPTPLRYATRNVPLVRVMTAIQILKKSWDRLEPAERSEAGRLIKKFRGRVSNLTQKERRELVRIARKASGLGR